MMQVSKRVPFDNPDVLNGVRALYIASNLIIAALYVYVQLQINKKKGMYDVDIRLGMRFMEQRRRRRPKDEHQQTD